DPPGKNVSRVMHAEIQATEADEDGSQHRHADAVELGDAALRDPHHECAERQVDNGRRQRVAAREALTHDVAEVRNDLRARTLKEVFEEPVDEPAADARDEDEQPGSGEPLKQQEAGGCRDYETKDRRAAERGDIEGSQLEPLRSAWDCQIVRSPQRS